MNWLRRLFGDHDVEYGEYRGSDFSVRIKPGSRELVTVIHTREGTVLSLGGERIGKKWQGISVHIPQEVEAARASQIGRDLETAFRALRYGYEIAYLKRVETVPETEREAAIAELRAMGYQIEVSADRRKLSLKKLPDAMHINIEIARKQAPRMKSLLESVHGTRPQFEILAKSEEF